MFQSLGLSYLEPIEFLGFVDSCISPDVGCFSTTLSSPPGNPVMCILVYLIVTKDALESVYFSSFFFLSAP